MRIAFFIYGDIGMNSGGFLYDRKLVEHLRAGGNQVDIIPLPWMDYFRSIIEYRDIAANLIPELNCRDYDLILQDELAHPLLSILNRRIRRLNIPIITIVHHLRCSEEQPLWQSLLAASFEAVYLAGVDGLILNSRTTLESIRKLRTASGKSFIISAPGCDRFRNHFDPEKIQMKCSGPGPLLIVFAGNIIPRKGLHTLLVALREMPAGTWRLTVAGNETFNPGYAARIREEAENSGFGGNIKLLGQVHDTELAQLLQDSHVLVVPSSYEGFGMIYAEAMGFGLPVIGCRAGAAPELIEHGLNGFLTMPGDHSGIARHLLSLQNNRKILFEMSHAARQCFLKLPGWEEGLGRTTAFLQQFA